MSQFLSFFILFYFYFQSSQYFMSPLNICQASPINILNSPKWIWQTISKNNLLRLVADIKWHFLQPSVLLCLSAFNPSSQVPFEFCSSFSVITKRASFSEIKWSLKLTLILQILGDCVEGTGTFISRHTDLSVVVQYPWISGCFQML